MRRALLLVLCAGCSGGLAMDAGAGGGAGGGAAGDGEARPERVVSAVGGAAYLWIPDGGAPEGAPITITRVDGGWRLEPDGLRFERPALFIFPLAPGLPSDDGGAGFFSAELSSADGSVSSPATFAAAALGHQGAALGLGLVQVRHFSGLKTPSSAPAPEGVALRVDLDPATPGDDLTFRKQVRDEWTVALTFSGVPSDAGGLVGQAKLEASGALELRAPAANPYQQVVNLLGLPPVRVALPVRCASEGPAALTLYLWSDTFDRFLLRAFKGTCIKNPAARSAAGSGPPQLPGETAGEAGLEAALAEQLLLVPGWLPAPEAQRAARAATARVEKRPQGASVTHLWSVDCTTGCELGIDYTVKLTLTNAATEVAFVNGQVRIDEPAFLTFEPVIGAAAHPEALDFPSATDRQSLQRLDANAPYVAIGTYRCLKEGLGNLFAKLSFLESLDLTRGAQFTLREVEGPKIVCAGGDAVMLSENVRATKSGATGWSAAAPGATANVIHASDAVRAGFHPINPHSQLYAGVATFSSNPGLSPLTLASSLQTATATFNGTRYAVTGLAGAPVWGAADNLTVSAANPDGGAPLTLVVPAPPAVAPASFFGARDGLRTPVQLADGTFDTFFVSVVAGRAGAPAGQSGVLRSVRAAEMALDGGARTAPLLDEETIAVLNDLGWTVQALYVAAYREASTPLFFPGSRPVPVQAGRMFQVTPPDLAP